MSALIIHTEGGGRLAADSTTDDVRAIAKQIMEGAHTVIHLHGGLINEAAAHQMALRLDSFYRANNTLPVFFAWETGPVETIKNNLLRVAQEPVFQSLLKKLLRHVAGKLFLDIPGKSAGAACDLPSQLEVNTELLKREAGVEPYGGEQPTNPVQEVNTEELQRFEEDLDGDEDLQKAVGSVAASEGVRSTPGAKGLEAEVKPTASLLDDDVKDSIKATALEPGSRGLLSTAAVVVRATKVLSRVIKRYQSGRDHGVYTTVVEELLREFYISAAGSIVWSSMKKDALQNFDPPNTKGQGGGWTLLKELSDLVTASGNRPPKLSIVAHSAGSIFACAMLNRMAESFPNLKLHKLVLLAAACRCDLLGPVLKKANTSGTTAPWEAFRSYALSDASESGYWEIPGLYPRSLLYLVSGAAETDKNNESAFDMPIAGMQRYFANEAVYKDDADILSVRKYLGAVADRRVWATENSGDGRISDAVKHGGFDDTDGPNVGTMTSVAHFLKS